MAKKRRVNTTKRETIKPEATRSRAAKRPEQRILQIDKLGKTISYEVPGVPYRDNPNQRAAFVGGFESRVQQVNSNLMPEEYAPVQRFDVLALQAIFEEGYNEAARQDGLHIKAKTLQGSTTGKAKK